MSNEKLNYNMKMNELKIKLSFTSKRLTSYKILIKGIKTLLENKNVCLCEYIAGEGIMDRKNLVLEAINEVYDE